MNDDEWEWRFRRRFADRVRELRYVRGLTQQALADKCGISKDTLRRVEQAGPAPNIVTLRRVARGLEVSLATIFLDLDEQGPEREVLDLLSTRTPDERALAYGVLLRFFGEREGSGPE